MNTLTTKPTRVGFELKTCTVPIASIVPLKPMRPTTKASQKYRQIMASIRKIGLVECPVITPAPKKKGVYYLLDGLLRVEAIKDLGWIEVECLISTDDEAYTYNKRINRLSSVQEHKMIARAVERGVSEELIAEALDIEVGSVRRRFRLLDGICPEVADLLADKPCPMLVFDLLKQMKPLRQMEAAELMVGQKNFSSPFARTILAATSDDQLVQTRAKSKERDISHEQIARLERELEAAQGRTKYVEETYGEDNLQLTIAKTYLAKLLRSHRITRWLQGHRPEFLAEFQDIAELTTLTSGRNGAALVRAGD